jgi:hypothetical protein
MASTYTTDNGIEKPSTGDRSGTWGTMVNSNMDLVDQALDGFVSITAAATGSTGSPNTLPITDGAVSDGRNRIITIVDGGDLGGTVYYQVTPNDAEKWFWIKNGLTASRAILLFQGTYNASNDLEIPNGKTCLVRCDGGGSGAVVSYVAADSQVTGSLAVDNLLLDGNTISSTDSNGAVTITANGTGTMGIGSASTGAVTITPATTITGVATLTAQPILSSLTASKPVFTDASKGLVSTGTLAYDQGGTGQTTYAAGDIVYASAIDTLSKLTVGTTGQVLKVAAGVPSWATDTTTGTVTSVGMTAPAVFTVSGSPVTTTGTLALTYSGTALPEVNGGTAQTTYTTGDLLYASGSNTLAKLAVGTTGQVLKVTAGAPAWGSDSAGTGTVTSIDVSGGTTGLTTSGGPITTSGTITLAGTLDAANGGTGVANNAASTLTISGAYATTLTVTAATGVTLPTTGTLATLAGTETLTNKTLTSPTLTTPALGTPASGDLSSCTADGTDEVGFKNIPQNSQSAAYTLVLADAGKHIFHPSGDANARTYTIPANASVAYPIGTALTFINMTEEVVTIAITTDTMYLSSDGTTGSRSLAQYGSATAIKMTSTTWLISGSGLT